MIYTTNLLQLQEALLNYACTSSITSNNTMKIEEDLLSIISNLAVKMFPNDTMLVFPFAEHEETKKTLSLTQKLKDRQISVNVYKIQLFDLLSCMTNLVNIILQ